MLEGGHLHQPRGPDLECPGRKECQGPASLPSVNECPGLKECHDPTVHRRPPECPGPKECHGLAVHRGRPECPGLKECLQAQKGGRSRELKTQFIAEPLKELPGTSGAPNSPDLAPQSQLVRALKPAQAASLSSGKCLESDPEIVLPKDHEDHGPPTKPTWLPSVALLTSEMKQDVLHFAVSTNEEWQTLWVQVIDDEGNIVENGPRVEIPL